MSAKPVSRWAMPAGNCTAWSTEFSPMDRLVIRCYDMKRRIHNASSFSNVWVLFQPFVITISRLADGMVLEDVSVVSLVVSFLKPPILNAILFRCPRIRPSVEATTLSTRFSARPEPVNTSLAPSSSIWSPPSSTKSGPAPTVNSSTRSS